MDHAFELQYDFEHVRAFTPCIFCVPADGVSLGIRYRRKGQNLEWCCNQMDQTVLR